ncbi:unnamed protein product [Trichobilharzia regenti]|nr:unnamed protein product [Trichobilharzia regenti]
MANEDDMDEVSCAEMLIRKTAVEDSDRADLFQLFAYLHAELEARDIALAALKVDILSFIFFQADHINAANLRAKYGIIISDKQSNKECEDPFQALQRDSVEYEKLQNKKLTRDVKRAVLGWREQHILCNRQKLTAASLIKERKRLCSQLANEQKRVAELERALQNNDLIIKLDSYDNKAGETAVSGENKLCCDRQCELLRKKLVEETENRKKIESNFER